MEVPSTHPRPRAGLLATAAVVAASASVVCIWIARIHTSGAAYVSEMGAPGMPFAAVLNFSLVLLALAAFLVERTLGRIWIVQPYAVPLLGVLLLGSGFMFAIASAVTCTAGCPVPFTAGSTVQDFFHILSAVVGFGAALLAMIVVARTGRIRSLRVVSVLSFLTVAAAALTGAAISVFNLDTAVGGWLEFVAATVAIVWFAMLAWHLHPAHPVSSALRADHLALRHGRPRYRRSSPVQVSSET